MYSRKYSKQYWKVIESHILRNGWQILQFYKCLMTMVTAWKLPKIAWQLPEIYVKITWQLHSDAFFRSQRDINRHGSWLDFWKIQVNLVNFISGTFGTAWDKYSKNGLTFGCLREKKGWNFDLEIIFFKQKQDFGIFIQTYMNI